MWENKMRILKVFLLAWGFTLLYIAANYLFFKLVFAIAGEAMAAFFAILVFPAVTFIAFAIESETRSKK